MIMNEKLKQLLEQSRELKMRICGVPMEVTICTGKQTEQGIDLKKLNTHLLKQ